MLPSGHCVDTGDQPIANKFLSYTFEVDPAVSSDGEYSAFYASPGGMNSTSYWA